MSESKARAIRERDRLATLLINLMCDLDNSEADEMMVEDFRRLPSYQAALQAMGGTTEGLL